MSLEAHYKAIRQEVTKVIYGQDEVVDFALAALFSSGHVLLEGPPGVAKTLLVRTIAAALSLDYRRVQMTPDLLPIDITGSSLFREDTRTFEFRPGPVFTNFLLADEINRASARTQSALLEAMQELCVTYDGVTHPLPEPFITFATQNPIEQEGTYPLPLAQLDRFMFKVVVSYPGAERRRADPARPPCDRGPLQPRPPARASGRRARRHSGGPRDDPADAHSRRGDRIRPPPGARDAHR